MQNELTESGLQNSEPTRVRASAPRAERIRPAAAEALDAAFDEYTRIDVPSQMPRGDAAQAMTSELIANIAAQLDILDRQRQQLAALLRDAV